MTVRRTATTVLIGLTLITAGLGGCGKQSPQAQTPTTSTVLGGSATPTPTPGAEATASPTAAANPAAYPATAKGYAQALLSAWAAKNTGRLDQLAVQPAVQQIKDNGQPDAHWTYISCAVLDTAATECLFRNAHGDEVRVKLTTAQLGHPTAVTEALLDKTTYPSDPAGYVGAFVDAWRNGNLQRMTRLADSTLTAYFKNKPVPGGTTVSGTDNTAGHTKITISEVPASGTQWTFNVTNQYLGKAHAIAGLCDPGCA